MCLLKKSTYEWTCTAQTQVAQGTTVVSCSRWCLPVVLQILWCCQQATELSFALYAPQPSKECRYPNQVRQKLITQAASPKARTLDILFTLLFPPKREAASLAFTPNHELYQPGRGADVGEKKNVNASFNVAVLGFKLTSVCCNLLTGSGLLIKGFWPYIVVNLVSLCGNKLWDFLFHHLAGWIRSRIFLKYTMFW